MCDLSSFPNTHNEEVQTQERAEKINCPYFYFDPKYYTLDQCVRPDACTCWQDVQILNQKEDSDA